MMRIKLTKNSSKLSLASVCICAVAFFWGNSVSIFLKANAAKFLIAHAWEKSIEDGTVHKPWSWADTWPIGKLYFPKRGLSLYILAGAHGSSLAFGPGHIDGTALPSEFGTKVIGGHRDTHFKFLAEIEKGEVFLLQTQDGEWRYYRVEETRIANTENGPWMIDRDEEAIHLITCYPFDSLVAGGPLRFIAIAEPIFWNPEETLSRT